VGERNKNPNPVINSRGFLISVENIMIHVSIYLEFLKTTGGACDER